MWKLQIVDDQGQRSEVPLNDAGELTIGRHESNAIRLPDRNVSRRHARISQRSGDFFIEDIGSSFGIRLNGETVSERTALHAGDRVQIGDYLLMLQSEAMGDLVHAENEDEYPVYADGRPVLINREERGRLVATSSNLHGLEYSLDRTPLLLGRAEECAIRLDHRSVSNEHAKILYKDGAYSIEDMGSSNGLKVNGERYTTTTLRDGDEIELGHVKLKFAAPGSSTAVGSNPVVADSAQPTSTGARKFALFVVSVVAIGLAVAWFGYFSQPTQFNRTRPTAIAARSAEPSTQPEPAAKAIGNEMAAVEPAQVAEAAAEPTAEPTADQAKLAAQPENAAVENQVAPEPPAAAAEGVPQVAEVAKVDAPTGTGDQEAAVATTGADLEAAKVAMANKEWDAAISAYDRVLAQNSAEVDARTGRDRAVVERERRDKVAAADALYAKGNAAGAYSSLKAAQSSIPNESAYAADIKSRLNEWKPKAITTLVADGQAALNRGDAKKAAKFAENALSIDNKNTSAKNLAKAAAKAQKAAVIADGSTTSPNVVTPPTTSAAGAPAGGTPSSRTAKELYSDARKAATAGQDTIALNLFSESLNKGYTMAHKQLGVIYARRGEAKKAVEHYEAYLRIHKDAPDAESVRTAIERLRQ